MADSAEEVKLEEGGPDEGGAPAADEEVQAELYGEGGEGDGEEASDGAGDDAAQADGQGAGGGGGVPAPAMTKSQMKKQAKIQRMLAKRSEARQREKEAKAARRAEASERKAAELASMTEEQKAELKKESKARLEAHREAERQLKERLKQSMESGPRVVIDLDWESRMTHNDMRHLVQQLGFSYAANKQVARPVHMMLTSFKGGVAELANKMISGMDKWYTTRTEQHYAELFGSPEDRARLVYLTADAQDELDELDENKIYIIGGLVDHNRHKGLCEQQARAAGIATARLPIQRHIQLASRAVLTVNHVFQILAEYFNRRDWAASLDFVLPKRKRAEYAQEAQQGQGQDQRQQHQQHQQGRGGRKGQHQSPGQPQQKGPGGGPPPVAEGGTAAAAAAAAAAPAAEAVPGKDETKAVGTAAEASAAEEVAGKMEVEGAEQGGRGAKRKAEGEAGADE